SGSAFIAPPAFAQQPRGDAQDRRRLRRAGAGSRGLPAERAGGERDRSMSPLGGASVRAARLDRALAHVREELRRAGGAGGFGPRAADVDSRVIVGAADPGAIERADVGRLSSRARAPLRTSQTSNS